MRLRRRKLSEGIEVKRIATSFTLPPRRPEVSFLGLTDRLRIMFTMRHNRRQMDVFVLMGEEGVTWRDRLRGWTAGKLMTEGLRRRYRADLLRRNVPEGAEDQAFDRLF